MIVNNYIKQQNDDKQPIKFIVNNQSKQLN